MLTDTACKSAHRSDKAKLGKAFKLADEKGLSFGTYPEVSLDQARQRRGDARKLIADGVDPGENRPGSRYFCESLFWASQPKQAAKT
jgi:hypothetical protein